LPEIEEPVTMQEEQEEEPVVEHIELKSEYAPTLVIESTTVVEETILLQETVAQVEEPVFVEEDRSHCF